MGVDPLRKIKTSTIAKTETPREPATQADESAGRPVDHAERYSETPIARALIKPQPPTRIALTFSMTPTAELTKAAAFLKGSVREDQTITKKDFELARQHAAAIPDLVQREVMIEAIETIEDAAVLQGDLLELPNAAVARLATDASVAIAGQWALRATAAIEHPHVRALAARPGGDKAASQTAELLVRYFSDPVFHATIHQRLIPHGGTANARQWGLGGERKLHAIDEYFGQCNETQARTQAIFERFAASVAARGETLHLEGRPITERSRVLLAYGIAGDDRGDDHMLFSVRTKLGAEVYLDPWVTQRADGNSVYRAGDYQNMRQGWDVSRWYEPGLQIGGAKINGQR